MMRTLLILIGIYQATNGAVMLARAVLDNAPEPIGILPECERRWGKAGLAGLAAAVVSGSFFPVPRRGLDNACEPVPAGLMTEAELEQARETANA